MRSKAKKFRDRDRAVAAYHRAVADKLADGYRKKYGRAVTIAENMKVVKKPGKKKAR